MAASPLIILIGSLLALAVAILVILFVLIPLLKGFGWLIRHIFEFIFGELSDLLRFVGAVVTSIVLVPMVVLNIIIGRWSAASHFGRAVQNEIATAGTCIYRCAIGHPARLFLLTPLTDGIERRLPEVVAAAPAADKPKKGRVGQFDGYKIVGSLPGGGSGGKLYVAEPDEMKLAAFSRQGQSNVSQVVIKVFSLKDGSSLPQIVRESRSLDAAKRLGLILEHELNDERFFYVMEYVPGDSLTLVTQNLHAKAGSSGLPSDDLRKVMGYGSDLLGTLAQYHKGGLWHKDVKPDNIIVAEDQAHLVDLGLITPLRSAMTLTTHGTEYFRDPEMVRMALRGVKVHQVDGAKFDVYAAGAVLYAMVENSFPAHGGLSQVTKRCPDALRWVIRRAMAEYEKRYASAAQMMADLDVIANADDPFQVKPAHLPSMKDAEAPEGVATPDSLWGRISAHAGDVFTTKNGMDFTYQVHGDSLTTSRTDYNIHRSSFEKAYDAGPVAGPNLYDEEIRGQSYVWAMLHDARIGGREWVPVESEPVGTPVPPVQMAAEQVAAEEESPATPRKLPRIRVTDWWTGKYVVDGQDSYVAGSGGESVRDTAASAMAVARQAAREAAQAARAAIGDTGGPAAEVSTVSARRVARVPREHRMPAKDQLETARARAAAARERARDRMSSNRRRVEKEFSTGPNAGVAIALFLFLAACVGVVATILSMSPTSNKTFTISIAEGDVDSESSSDVNFESFLAELPEVSGVVLAISDLQPPISDAARDAVNSRVSALEQAGLQVVGELPGRTMESNEFDMVVAAEKARPIGPLDSDVVKEAMASFMSKGEFGADLVMWISLPASDDAENAEPLFTIFAPSEGRELHAEREATALKVLDWTSGNRF